MIWAPQADDIMAFSIDGKRAKPITTSEKTKRAVVIAIDCSGSMGHNNKLHTVKRSVMELLTSPEVSNLFLYRCSCLLARIQNGGQFLDLLTLDLAVLLRL